MIEDVLKALITADAKSLHFHHEHFVARVHDLLEDTVPSQAQRRGPFTTSQAYHRRKQTEFDRALEKLADLRPKAVDVSDSGAALVSEAIDRWKAGHKPKFMAHRKMKRDMQGQRPTKRVKLDREASDSQEHVRSEESEVEYDEWLYSNSYRDGSYDTCYLENEAGDSDSEKWGYAW